MWNPEFPHDGETPGAISLNLIFSEARDFINDIDRNALRRGALNIDLAPPIFLGDHPVSVWHDGDASGALVYDRATFGNSVVYTTHGANGGSDSVPTLGSGDRSIIGHPSSNAFAAPACQVNINNGAGALLDNNGTDRVQAILIFMNVEVKNIRNDAGSPGVMTCIQFRVNGAGTWYTIGKTEHIANRNSHKIVENSAIEGMWYDLPTVTLLYAHNLTEKGLDPTTDLVSNIRGMTSINNPAAASILEINRYRLTAIPILGSLQVT